MKANKSEFINGKYYTKKEAADLIGISYNVYISRIYTLNKTPQEAYDMGKNGNKSKKSEFINGRYYTKKEAAKLIGISYNNYQARLFIGKTPQEAYEMGGNGNKNKKSELINGKYYTKKEAAKLIGISYNKYRARLVTGKTPQEAYDMGENGNKSKKSEFINGKYYTKKEAAKLIGIKYQTYMSRKRNMDAQEAFNLGKYVKKGIKPIKSEFINGKYYTQIEAAALTGMSITAYRAKIKSGIAAQEIFNNGKYTNVGRKAKKSELINGKYYTVKEAAELIGLSYRGYTKRKEIAGTAQEAFDMGVKGYRKTDKTELINGEYYTVAEAADLIGISYNNYLVRKWRNHTAQEAFDMGENGRLKKK